MIVEDDKADFRLAEISFQNSNLENGLVWLKSEDELLSYLAKEDEFQESGHANPLLIYLDLNLSRRSGKDLVDYIEKQVGISELRIVLLTGLDKEFVDDMKLGDMSYIHKPLTYEKLCEFVSNRQDLLLK